MGGIYNPSPSGSGDMQKSVYDTNDDGKVNSSAVADSANAVAWGNVSGKPSVFAPDSHSHDISGVMGLQAALDNKQNNGQQLNDLAGLSYSGNSLKVVRVNAGETGLELATVSSGGLEQYQVRRIIRR